ncbi:MAG: DUF3500 domain-containing protein [Saprospiraceae bacterium]|nr:DUF3500 domain-containing protein [Saprospiraceae bacterium]
MKKSLFLLALVFLFSCQEQPSNLAEVTFQIDMSDILADIADPETIGIVGSGPLEWAIIPLEDAGNGIFSKTFKWNVEDSVMLEYTFIHSYDTFDEGDIGDAAYRTYTLTPGQHVLPLVKWGVLDEVNTGRATPSPMLKVERADSEAEKKALNIPFFGVTATGVIEPDLFSIQATGISTANIKLATEAFLDALTAEQRANCTFPIDDQEWRRWSNIDYYERKGIGLRDMTEDQKLLAFQIMKESLSPQGFKKTQDIMKMEGYLARLSGEFDALGSDLYWFSFMGTPSETEPWGWQIDGHHLVINYFILGDQVVMTPTFLGSEPNYIADGENSGTRTFEYEEILGLKLYHSLDNTQKTEATLFDRKEYNFFQTGAFCDNSIVPYLGLKLSSLNPDQVLIFEELVLEYIGNMDEGHAAIRMKEILEHRGETYFSWVGAMDGKGPFYYRIHSPVVMIEFDHQKPIFLPGNKPGKKHVHTIVRTPNGNDYGKDLLRQHLEAEHQH